MRLFLSELTFVAWRAKALRVRRRTAVDIVEGQMVECFAGFKIVDRAVYRYGRWRCDSNINKKMKNEKRKRAERFGGYLYKLGDGLTNNKRSGLFFCRCISRQ